MISVCIQAPVEHSVVAAVTKDNGCLLVYITPEGSHSDENFVLPVHSLGRCEKLYFQGC